MNPARLMTIPCTITTRTGDGAADVYNDPTDTDATVDTVCWHHPGKVGGQTQQAGAEQTGLAELSTQDEAFYFPPATAWAAASTVTVGGVTFEAFGPAAPFLHPRTHQVVLVAANTKRAE